MEVRKKYSNNTDQEAWYGSKTSCESDLSRNDDTFMTFQSKEPIMSIPMREQKERKSIILGPGPPHPPGHALPVTTVEHPTSYGETLMHLFKGNVGSGIFAMGDAIRNAGIIVGPIIIIVIGMVCLHCEHLLVRTAKHVHSRTGIDLPPDFAETVGTTFSASSNTKLNKLANLMKKLVNIFLCITQVGFCCVYFVFVATNVKQVCDYYGLTLDLHFHMAIILLPILLSSLVRNLKFLAPLSAVANVLMLIGIIITLYYCCLDVPHPSERKYYADLYQLPLFFGTALFAFEGIGLVLPLQNEMKKPEEFSKVCGVLNVGIFNVTFLYTLVGFIAYMKYGEGVKGSVTLNLPEDEILGQSVKIMIAIGILLTYALQFYIPIDIMWPGITKCCGPFKYPVFAELSFRTGLVLVTFILAEAIPFLSLIISLVGSVSSTALALIFPPIIELVSRSSNNDLNFCTILKDVIILIIGILGMVTGTYQSIAQIVHAFQKKYST